MSRDMNLGGSQHHPALQAYMCSNVMMMLVMQFLPCIFCITNYPQNITSVENYRQFA